MIIIRIGLQNYKENRTPPHVFPKKFSLFKNNNVYQGLNLTRNNQELCPISENNSPISSVIQIFFVPLPPETSTK
jgi:hypothetical protein